jgi:hypothetical protein
MAAKMMVVEEKPSTPILPKREEKLILMIRRLGFGQVNIFVADGQSVLVEEVRKSIKL